MVVYIRLVLTSFLMFACNPFGDSKFSDIHLNKDTEDSNLEIVENIQFKLSSNNIIRGTSTSFNVKLLSNFEEKDITGEVLLSFANNKANKSSSNSILGLESGTVAITAKYKDLNQTQTLTIIQEEPISITITPSSVELNASETAKLKAIANYNNGTTTDATNTVIWSSSSQTVTSINSSGLITALVQGTSVITARISGTNLSATRNVVVNPYRPTYISSNRLWLDASNTSTLFQDHTQLLPISASGQTVGSWNDLSGNNYHFTQSSGGSRPTYLQNQTSTGQACISFSANQILLSNSLLGLATGDPRTFIAVGKINNTANARESFLSHALPGNCCQYMGFDTRTTGAAFFGIYFPSAHLESNYPLDTNLHVFNIKILDTTVGALINPNINVIHKIDGTTNVLTTIVGGPNIANHSGMTVTSIGGGTGTGWVSSLIGLVCEIMAFKEPLSQTEENYIQNYLKTKWGTP